MIVLSNEMFSCEHLGSDLHTQEQINSFSVKPKEAENLGLFLKELAATEEVGNANRTYLVKDKISKEIVCYFSLRNGLFTISASPREFITIPAIELSNFAVNQTYKEKNSGIHKLGSMTFKEFILPLIKHVQGYSGVQALYLYSLPYPDLINHYKTLGFTRLNEEEEKFIHKHVKPKYDRDCIFMCQRV